MVEALTLIFWLWPHHRMQLSESESETLGEYHKVWVTQVWKSHFTVHSAHLFRYNNDRFNRTAVSLGKPEEHRSAHLVFHCTFQVTVVWIFVETSPPGSCHIQHSGCFLRSRPSQYAVDNVCRTSANVGCRCLYSVHNNKSLNVAGSRNSEVSLWPEPFNGDIKTAQQRIIIQQYGDLYTGCWWVGCYIWYSEEGNGRGHTLKIGVTGPSRSFKKAPFGGSRTSSYSSSIVTTAVSWIVPR